MQWRVVATGVAVERDMWLLVVGVVLVLVTKIASIITFSAGKHAAACSNYDDSYHLAVTYGDRGQAWCIKFND